VELDRLRGLEQERMARSALLPQVSLTASPAIARAGPSRAQVVVPVQNAETGELTTQQRVLQSPAVTRTSLDLTLNLNQLIYDAGRWARLSQAGYELESLVGQAQQETMASEFEGIRRFYAVHRAQRTLEVYQARVKEDEALLKRATDLVEAGKRSRSDIQSALVNLGNDRIQSILEQGQVTVAGSDLAMWLGRDGTEVLSTVPPQVLEQPLKPLPTWESVLATARESHPLLKVFRAQLRSAEANISVARSGYLPRVGATVTYNRASPTTDPFFTDLSQQNTLGANVLLSWNLYNGSQTQAQVRDAELLRDKTKVNFIQYEKELHGEAFKAYVVLQAQMAASEVAEINLQQAREGLRIALDLYSAGALPTLEVRDAQLKLTNAELTWLESRIDVEIAWAALEFNMGTLGKGAP